MGENRHESSENSVLFSRGDCGAAAHCGGRPGNRGRFCLPCRSPVPCCLLRERCRRRGPLRDLETFRQKLAARPSKFPLTWEARRVKMKLYPKPPIRKRIFRRSSAQRGAPMAASVPGSRTFRHRLGGRGEPRRPAAVTLPVSDSRLAVIRVEPWSVPLHPCFCGDGAVFDWERRGRCGILPAP